MMEQRAPLAISEEMCMEIAPESISVWMVDAK
jgi:alpha-glucosidase